MSTHKRIDAICAAITALTIVLTVLFMNGEALGIAVIASEESGGMFTANDLNADWNTASAARIMLSDGGSTISGNGAYVYDGDVYIIYPGYYVLTGSLTDGSVIVNANQTDKIWILLDGVSIRCEDSAALRIEQADKVFLTLAEGTSSTLSSGAQYSQEVMDTGVDGVIYSRDDLTINGSGSLSVTAEYKHGIVCNDDLAITGGDITVSAVQDGIHANDSVRIREASLSITAGDDGITVSNDDETAFLYIESGAISIPSCYEGLEAIDITIAGGSIDIVPTDDGINANGSGASSVLRITGGDISIINPAGRDADGLDSNGSIYIEGGNTFISVSGSGSNCAIDYGTENGGECVISGGTVIACGGSTMAEGFDAASPQGFIMHTVSGAAGTALVLADASGQELLSAEIPCDFTSIVLSTPALAQGDACTLSVGGSQEQLTVDNSAAVAAGMFRGGMKGGRDFAGAPEGGEAGTAPSFPQEQDGAGRAFPDGDSQPAGGAAGGDSSFQPPEGEAGYETFQPMDRSQMPERQEGGRTQGGGFPDGMQGGMPNGMQDGLPDASAPALSGSALILLAASFAVLLAGLAAAFKFKR